MRRSLRARCFSHAAALRKYASGMFLAQTAAAMLRGGDAPRAAGKPIIIFLRLWAQTSGSCFPAGGIECCLGPTSKILPLRDPIPVGGTAADGRSAALSLCIKSYRQTSSKVLNNTFELSDNQSPLEAAFAALTCTSWGIKRMLCVSQPPARCPKKRMLCIFNLIHYIP